MRLLNTHTYRVEEFLTNVPKYAILSHTWDEDEITFQDIQNLDVAKTKTGWSKVQNACAYVQKYKFEWIWIDTCCIDKSSSAELSEVLNSMYKYYKEARVCIAYLNDLEKGPRNDTELLNRLKRCKWFTRGWTLQELIAPRYMAFLDKDWQHTGTRFSLRHFVSEVTSVPFYLFEGDGNDWEKRQLEGYSIAQKMSWAASRETTRPEDMAYCLMGLFGVNMPPIYGEGGEKAFMRLQQEIIKYSDDRSIFAWVATKDYEQFEERGLFASSPSEFTLSGQVEMSSSWKLGDKSSLSFGNNGLRIHLPLHSLPNTREGIFIASLHCEDDGVSIGIYLQKKGHRYIRWCPHFPLPRARINESFEDSSLQEVVVKENVVLCQPERDYGIPIELKLDPERTLLGEVDTDGNLCGIPSRSMTFNDYDVDKHVVRLQTQKGKEFDVCLNCSPNPMVTGEILQVDDPSNSYDLQDSDLSRIEDENALVSLFIHMTGDFWDQKIVEINYIPSSSPNFELYHQIDGFECSTRTSSLKTCNFVVGVEPFASYGYSVFPSGLLRRRDLASTKTSGSIPYSPEQRDVHRVFMYKSWEDWEERNIFITLGLYTDQEDFYRREPWIDVFVSDDKLPISDVWQSYRPFGSRYGHGQDINGGAMVVVDDSTSVTVTVQKIWDDPVLYYIILKENRRQWGQWWKDYIRSIM